MQSEDKSFANANKTTQTEPEVAPANPTQICVFPIETGNVYDSYKHTQSKICGAIQIIIGILSIMFNVIDISQMIGPAVIGHGIWCGVVFILAGSLGIAAGISRTKCPCVAFMVLCIVSASLSAVLLCIGIMSFFFLLLTYLSAVTIVSFVMQSCLVILAVIEAGVAIWGSVICCEVVCCGATRPVAAVLYRSNDPFEKLMIVPQGHSVGQLQIPPASASGDNELTSLYRHQS